MNKLLATLLILCAGPVWAEWILAGRTEQAEYYIDLSTVRGEGIKRIWTKIEMKMVKNTKGQSSQVLMELDCQNEKSRTLQASIFAGPNLSGGRVEDYNSRGEDWRYIEPWNFERVVFNYICKK